MSDTSKKECPQCRKNYNRNQNKPFIMKCGDTFCSSCIKKLIEQVYKKVPFKCPCCCNETESLNIINFALMPADDSTDEDSNNTARAPAAGEFDIHIKQMMDSNIITIKVKKSMKVKELKSKIEKARNYKEGSVKLAFKRPLNNDDQTLESYGIDRELTINLVGFVRGGI